MATRAAPSHMHATYVALPPSIGLVRDAVLAFARRSGADERCCEDIVLAVSEAASNVVLHAYLEVEPGSIEVEAERRPHALVVSVTDHGRGMKPRPDSPGLGLGLVLIARVAQAVEIESRSPGVRMRMTFSTTT